MSYAALQAVAGPRLAIIVPIFKHAVLVTEALASALREAREMDGVVVIVNDGCPFQETHQVCESFALADPTRVIYIRTPNGGLSAARNCGIRLALARFPSLEAIYLLDADNRLGAGAMRRAMAVLAETGAAWVYPNIDKFGLEWNGDFSAPYNPLRHLFQNICEAGSLIHRRVFDAGVWFDETMRQGYEDWEFWLQALEAGFHGAPCADFGLQYRSRRESMVRDSDRDGQALISGMQRKHKRLFTPAYLLAAEHRSAPRYCIIDVTTGRYVFTSILGLSSSDGDLTSLERAFWGNRFYPSHVHFPHIVVFADAALMSELARLRLADTVFWQIEDALESNSVVAVGLEIKSNAITLNLDGSLAYESFLKAGRGLLAISLQLLSECVLDPQTAWIESLKTPTPEPLTATFQIAAPFIPSLAGRHSLRTQPDAFFHTFFRLRGSVHRPIFNQPWEWRVSESVIPGAELFRHVRTQLKAFAPIASASLLAPTREIAFVLPLVSFGGVEQVGIAVARQFKAAGWRTRLVVTQANEAKAPERLLAVFDTILFLNDTSYATWAPSDLKYYGHELQSWPLNGRHDRLIGLLSGCAAVMMLHANHGYEVMGWLRRQGTVTINSLHLLDRDIFHVPVGHPYMSLAYEHAFDLLCAPSRKLLTFCAASGVPPDKLRYLPNAPSFTPDNATLIARTRMLDELTSAATRPRKLRVLSIGRLDRQKGGERLAQLVAASEALELPIEWRLVGGQVVVGEQGPQTTLVIEPPVYDRAAMIERLLWADVVVLLSRWEGSPLLILEAQCLGTIPIATKTGAVEEMINHGEDGFLLPNGDIHILVAEAINILESLAECPASRAALGYAAIARSQAVNWETSSACLIEAVTTLAEAAEAKLDAPQS